jgi:hypothetical protein
MKAPVLFDFFYFRYFTKNKSRWDHNAILPHINGHLLALLSTVLRRALDNRKIELEHASLVQRLAAEEERLRREAALSSNTELSGDKAMTVKASTINPATCRKPVSFTSQSTLPCSTGSTFGDNNHNTLIPLGQSKSKRVPRRTLEDFKPPKWPWEQAKGQSSPTEVTGVLQY